MSPIDAPAIDRELDDYLARFEAAHAHGSALNLTEFLPPRGHPKYAVVLRELVRVDLEFAWDRGEERRLEEYRDRFPALFADRAGLRDVAWEECRLRQAAGETPTAAEYRDRFGLDLADLIEPSDDEPRDPPNRTLPGPSAISPASGPTQMPGPGDEVAGFVVDAELGRGAFGRVFLARQSDLADRPVVIKVSSKFAGESQTLARLQHANIVPVYSQHRFGPYHVICMPFLGATTLADVLEALRLGDGRPVSGKDLASTVGPRADRTHLAGDGADVEPPPTPGTRPNLDLLERLTYVEAVLWFGAELADGLAHAHARGIIHRDIKPANVLFSDEGRPMLLDFNLAADGAKGDLPVGGTLRYMAPEVLAAAADHQGWADARSDVYSLGLVLFELLTGTFPFPDQTDPAQEVVARMRAARVGPAPDAARHRPDVSPAVAAILKTCLAADPAQRYATAAHLREDLRRQLDHRPLKYAPDRSVRERLGKWARRHPRLSSGGTIATVAAAILIVLASAFVARQRHIEGLEAERSASRLTTTALAAQALTTRDAPATQLRDVADRARDALEPLGVLDDGPWTSARTLQRMTAATREKATREAVGLLLDWQSALALLHDRESIAGTRSDLLNEAFRLNDRAAAAFPPGGIPSIIADHRARLDARAGRAAAPEIAGSIRGPDGAFVRAVADVGTDRTSRAELEGLCRDQPHSYSARMLLGLQDLRHGHWERANRGLTAAATLEPDDPWAYFWRGTAALEAFRFADATTDYDRALELRADLPEAYLNRAIARIGLKEYASAVADLDRLEKDGAPLPRLFFIRETAKRLAGDTAGADADRAAGLARTPTDAAGWNARGESRLRSIPPDASGALADFDAAVDLDPGFWPGWQSRAHVLSEHLGKPEEAVLALDRAVEIQPDAVPSLAGRAVLLARLGKSKAARADAARCLVLDESALTLYQVACVDSLTARTVADRAGAITHLRAALRKDATWASGMPTDPDLKAVKDEADFRALIAAAGELTRDR